MATWFTPTFRLNVGKTGLGNIPYASHEATSGTWDQPDDSRGVAPIYYYAMKSIMRAFDSKELVVQGSIELPEVGLERRFRYDHDRFGEELFKRLYPTDILAYSSPITWYLLCSIFQDLPSRYQTFDVPLSDPFVVPFQRLPVVDGTDYLFLTTISLRGCLIGDEIFTALGKLRALTVLDLSATKVSSSGFAGFVKMIPFNAANHGEPGPAGLQIIQLGKCPNVTLGFVPTLRVFKRLQLLDLRQSGKPEENIALQHLPTGFTSDIPSALEEQDSPSELLRSLHDLNRESPKSKLPEEIMILSITSLDYPAFPQKRRVTELQAHPEGFYFFHTPSGKSLVGNAERLAASQERESQERSEDEKKPQLQPDRFDWHKRFQNMQAVDDTRQSRLDAERRVIRARRIPTLQGSQIFYRPYDALPVTSSSLPKPRPAKSKPVFEKVASVRHVDLDSKRRKLEENIQKAALARSRTATDNTKETAPSNPFRVRKK